MPKRRRAPAPAPPVTRDVDGAAQAPTFDPQKTYVPCVQALQGTVEGEQCVLSLSRLSIVCLSCSLSFMCVFMTVLDDNDSLECWFGVRAWQ